MFDEPLKKILDILPIPIIIGIALIIFMAWIFKSLKNHKNYGETIKNRGYQTVTLFIILGTIGYYSFEFYLKSKPVFEDKEIGVLVAKFNEHGTNSNVLQKYTISTLDIHRDRKKMNFEIKKYDYLILDRENAQKVLKDKNADILIWGESIKENCVTYHTIDIEGKLSHGIESDFLKDNKFIETVLSRIKGLGHRIINKEDRNSEKVLKLQEKINKLEKRLSILETNNRNKTDVTFTQFNKVYAFAVGPEDESIPFGADAKKFISWVQNNYPYLPKDSLKTYLFTGDKIRKNDILKSLNEVSKISKKEDLILIYLTSHNEYFPNKGKKTGFLKVNSDEGITTDEIQEYFTSFNSDYNILFIDACFSESLLPNFGTKKSFNVGIASSKKEQYSWSSMDNGGFFSNSLFSTGRSSGKGDINKDGLISVEEMFLYIKNNTEGIATEAGFLQNPIIEGNKKDFILFDLNAENLNESKKL